MKYIGLLIITIFIWFGFKPVSNNKKDIVAEIKDTLQQFTIVYTHGDNAVRTDYISVYQDGNKWYASGLMIGHPFIDYQSYYKVVKLGDNLINCCEEFIKTTEKLPEHCQSNSSVFEDLNLLVNGKTFIVNGPCDWGKMDFWALFDTLFGKNEFFWNNPKELKTIHKYNKAITGQWYSKPISDSMKTGDSLFFSRINTPNKSNIYWQFNGESGFYGQSKSALKALNCNSYELGLYPGKQRFALTIYWGAFNGHHGVDPCINFEVVKCDTTGMILRVLQPWK